MATNETDTNRIPHWMVAFVRFGPGQVVSFVECAGTLINASWVLTAAHAVIDPKTTTAVIGQNPLSTASRGSMIPIKRVIPHPSYTPQLTPPLFDLALVELNKPVDGPFVSRGEAQDFLPLGQVFGWGATVGQPGLYTDVMKQIAVTVEYPLVLQTFGSMTFNATSASALTTCYGDSGGPLLINSATGWRQIGIASSLTVARECRKASIYTGVASNKQFIDQVIAMS